MARDQAKFLSYKGNSNKAIQAWANDIKKGINLWEKDIVEKLEKVLDVVEKVAQAKVPEDTLATKNSFYCEVKVEGDKIVARAGYDGDGSLIYPVYIHEIPYNFKKPGAENRFLAKGFEQAYLRIEEIMKGDA